MKKNCIYISTKNVMLFIALFMVYGGISTSLADSIGSTNQYKVVDGFKIYMGIIPAEIIEGPSSKTMHGGVPTGPFRYHISIAVFDKKTGRRMTNARIEVKFSNAAGETKFHELEPMNFNGKIVFGNYFAPTVPGPYRIHVIVKTHDIKQPIKTEFHYQIGHAAL